MPIRILFEIGHKAIRKVKPLDTFTHDWELFVRGSDSKDMSKYVEKIVFNLHESFPNPIRTLRDPPYILKEAGYGGFLLPIDIYFKAGPRDEPKLLSITYDLDITKPQHVVKYNHSFMNPSTEFRYKLLEGGGHLTNNDGHEDRSQSESRSRCQVSSTTASTGGKKHKTGKAAEESKPLSTFENLFGPPIQNLPAKHSPVTASTDSHKTQKSSSKDRSSEKSSKEKKDKSKSSSSKDANHSKESCSKKSSTDLQKNDRRDDKRKDKSHQKDRDRSKEKPSKRPISPKSESRSPKRSTSPASHRTTSSNSSRHEPKLDDKSASGGKKSKKEKRDKSKERERSTTSDNKKDNNKEIKHQTQASTKQKDERSVSNRTLEKLNGSGKRDESAESNTPKDSTSRDKLSNSYRPAYDTKPPSPIDLAPQTKPQTPSDSKKSDKHDKDGSERKHKHKKEKKNKDKDKDKERKKDKDKLLSKSKELIVDESLNVPNHRTSTPTQHSNRTSTAKLNSTPQPAVKVQPPPSQRSSHLSDKSSSDYEMDDYMGRSTSPPPPKTDINDTNPPIDNVIVEASRSIQSVSPKKHADKSASNKKEKEPKPAQSSMPSKEDKKRKRKSKVDKLKTETEVNSSGAVSGGGGGGGGKRKVQSPMVNDELPSAKYSRKDDERSAMPIKKESIKKESMKIERMSPVITSSNKVAPTSTPSSPSSESIPSISENRPTSESPSSDKTYIAQLKALQQKIMTLQDNDELQQVVDMIAATGCYEITRSTFDFDLCALDRTTVQRLQERLG